MRAVGFGVLVKSRYRRPFMTGSALVMRLLKISEDGRLPLSQLGIHKVEDNSVAWSRNIEQMRNRRKTSIGSKLNYQLLVAVDADRLDCCWCSSRKCCNRLAGDKGSSGQTCNRNLAMPFSLHLSL